MPEHYENTGMPDMAGVQEGIDQAVGAVAEPALDLDTASVEAIPDQGGINSANAVSTSKIMLEDYFPQIELSEDERERLTSWFDRDLKASLKNVNAQKALWAKYRAVYMLEYMEKFYPDMGIGANYSSGLLCDKVLEGMDRMRKAVYRARPMFSPDTKRTGSNVDLDITQRAQWALHTYMWDDLKVRKTIGDPGMFDFVMDGSLIVEVDNVYSKVPYRTIKTYTDPDELMLDENKLMSDMDFEEAMANLQAGKTARVVVEEDVITEEGLQIIHVDKMDHLIPPGVYDDSKMDFRARRMYLYMQDLDLLAESGWYDKDQVAKLKDFRTQAMGLKSMSQTKGGENAATELNTLMDNADLWYTTDYLDSLTDTHNQPYANPLAVYKITAKYGYTTKNDKKGLIPKYCVFDYCPEGRVILRAVTFPHFTEHKNWFHFKFGYQPKSYYGFGYGARLIQDDFLESNAVDLYLDSAALASFNPFLCRHPEAGGRVPFSAGYGPAKIGYVNDVQQDFMPIRIAPPSDALVSLVLPMVQSRSSNRTNVTSLVQGNIEQSDPRSPAQKTAMLLGQANVGLDMMVDDWNVSGWDDLAQYVWATMYENALFMQNQDSEVTELYDGLVLLQGEVGEHSENQITIDELKLKLKWMSLASSDHLNPEMKAEKFAKMFSFFVPMLREMAQTKPDIYFKYFIRWMQRASQEMDVPGAEYLIPSMEDLTGTDAQGLQQGLESMIGSLMSGQPAQGMVMNQIGGGNQ
jgi:hypothetical protein